MEKVILDMIVECAKKTTKLSRVVDQAILENDERGNEAAKQLVLLEAKLYSLREVARAHRVSEDKINIAEFKGLSLALGVDTEKVNIFKRLE